jgi:exopolysaccharide production protein ExoZ
MTIIMLFFFRPELLDKADLLTSMFLLPDKSAEILIGVSWSLSYEIYFYILFFLLLFSTNRIKFIIVFFIIIIVFNVYGGYMFGLFTYRENNQLNLYVKFLTSLWLVDFFIGCFIANLIKHNVHKHPVFFLLTGVLFFVFGYYLNAHVFHGNLVQLPKTPYRISLFGIGSGLIIYGLASLEKQGHSFFPRFSVLAGGASYCIYLSHILIIDFLQYAGMAPLMQNGPLSPTACFLLIVIGIVCFSILFYHFFEKPVYVYVKNRIYKMRSSR